MKLWGGRFREQTAKEVEEFNSSLQFDYRLWEQDIAGSLAHVNMLAQVGILSSELKHRLFHLVLSRNPG
jgi:argininosuccinate lyase